MNHTPKDSGEEEEEEEESERSASACTAALERYISCSK